MISSPSAPRSAPAPRTTAVAAALRAWRPLDAGQAALQEEYLALVADLGDAALRKPDGAEHLTASAFVLTPELDHVLLALHRRAGLWLQLGGHVEDDDADLAAAAWREAREESGLASVRPWRDRPVDLDRHVLVGRFTCHTHWDVGHVAFASLADEIAVSDESEQVAWWPLDALPELTTPDLPRRLAHVVAEVRAG